MQIPRLREWRLARGLSQRELAEKVGRSERSIAGYEAGGGARPGTARILAEALDIEVTDLLEESARPKVTTPVSFKEASANQARFSELLGLRAARERRGMFQNELALMSGIPLEQLAALEDGRQESDEDTLHKLTDALKCSPIELGSRPEQYGAFLEEIEREHERKRRELEQMSPSDQRAMAMRLLLKSPRNTEFAREINESVERRAREQSEAG